MDQEQQQTHCPRCGRTATVCRKLLTAPWDIQTCPVSSGHLSVHQSGEAGHSHISGDFINGYYCDACDVGFVTDEVLREVGMSEHGILSQRWCFTPPRGTWGA